MGQRRLHCGLTLCCLPWKRHACQPAMGGSNKSRKGRRGESYAFGFTGSDFSPIWEQLSDLGKINGAGHCRPTYLGGRWLTASGDVASELEGRSVKRCARMVIESRRYVVSVASGSLIAQWSGHNNHPLRARARVAAGHQVSRQEECHEGFVHSVRA